MDLINSLIGSLGLSAREIARGALLGPILIMIFAIFSFFYSAHRNRIETARIERLRDLTKNARRRSSGLTAEELAKRLAPSKDEEGVKKVFVQVAEKVLILLKFNRKETEAKLIQAGDRDPRAISRYILQRGAGMIIAPVLAWYLAPHLGFAGPLRVPLALVGVLAGGILVDARLDKAVSRRRAQAAVEMPVLFDLLTIYLEAGQSFDISLSRASRALKQSFPTAAEEIAFLQRDLELSLDREKTLRDFADRLGGTMVQTFVSIVIQAERRGNAIAPSLRTLAREARKEVVAEIERKAQKLPTLMQLPMFLFILPAIFASVLGPVVIQVMNQFSH